MSDDLTKHFRGTCRYRISFDLPSNYISDALKLDLDLGVVGDIAEVRMNGIEMGIR